MAEIYGLYDRESNLRYIGKANDAKKRLAGHMREVRRRRTPLYDWLAKHGTPELRILEADCVDWRASERRLIAEARKRGDRLLNLADGGDEPFCPREVRAANARMVARKRTENPRARRIWEIKRMLGSALKDGHLMNRTREKMRRLAAINPAVFGAWASIIDREENPDGSAKQAHA